MRRKPATAVAAPAHRAQPTWFEARKVQACAMHSFQRAERLRLAAQPGRGELTVDESRSLIDKLASEAGKVREIAAVEPPVGSAASRLG